jgi:hypothetical protein
MADSKLTQLNDIGAAIVTTDIIYIVDDPGGTPLSRKTPMSRVQTFVGANPLTHTSTVGITATELTIASGVVTATRGYHLVDTESDGASDDLDTISGGVDGMRLTIRPAHTDRTVVVKDGTGNIQGPGDVTLDSSHDTCSMIYDATLTAWLVTGSSNNA